jgi:hypothetical protein
MTNSLEPSNLRDPGARPAWHWRFEDSAGGEVNVGRLDEQQFPSQGDAESWVGESWRDLLDQGVDAVTLFEGDRQVYGPMSLHNA